MRRGRGKLLLAAIAVAALATGYALDFRADRALAWVSAATVPAASETLLRITTARPKAPRAATAPSTARASAREQPSSAPPSTGAPPTNVPTGPVIAELPAPRHGPAPSASATPSSQPSLPSVGTIRLDGVTSAIEAKARTRVDDATRVRVKPGFSPQP